MKAWQWGRRPLWARSRRGLGRQVRAGPQRWGAGTGHWGAGTGRRLGGLAVLAPVMRAEPERRTGRDGPPRWRRPGGGICAGDADGNSRETLSRAGLLPKHRPVSKPKPVVRARPLPRERCPSRRLTGAGVVGTCSVSGWHGASTPRQTRGGGGGVQPKETLQVLVASHTGQTPWMCQVRRAQGRSGREECSGRPPGVGRGEQVQSRRMKRRGTDSTSVGRTSAMVTLKPSPSPPAPHPPAPGRGGGTGGGGRAHGPLGREGLILL